MAGCVREVELARTVMESLGDLERPVPTELGFSGARGLATVEGGARLPIGSEVGATGGGRDTRMGDGEEETFWGVMLLGTGATTFARFTELRELPLTDGTAAAGGGGGFVTTRLDLGVGCGGGVATGSACCLPTFNLIFGPTTGTSCCVFCGD